MSIDLSTLAAEGVRLSVPSHGCADVDRLPTRILATALTQAECDAFNDGVSRARTANRENRALGDNWLRATARAAR